MSSCFQAPKQWRWGTRPPLARLLVIFFLIRPTDPVRNAFDVKRKKKGGWPNPKPQTWRSKLSRKKRGPRSCSSNDPRSLNILGGREATRGALLPTPAPPPPTHKIAVEEWRWVYTMMILLETAIEILKVRLHWPFLVRFVLRLSANVKQDVLKKRSSFKLISEFLTENLQNCS